MATEPERSTASEDMQRLVNRAGGHAIHPEDFHSPTALQPGGAGEEVYTGSDLTTGRGQSGTAGQIGAGGPAGGNPGATAGAGTPAGAQEKRPSE